MRLTCLAACAALTTACVSTNPSRDFERPASPVTRTADDADRASPGNTASKSSTTEPAPSAATSTNSASGASAVEASTDVLPAPVVARVAGEEVLVGELLAFWLHNRSEEVREMLEHLVSAKLIGLEARRLGVELSVDDVDLALFQSIRSIEEEIRRQDPTTSFREFVEVRLGLDSERYRSQLRWEVERKMLGERVVRAFVMGQDRVQLRVVVVRTEEDVRAAQARLAEGEEFGVVAREFSVDPSAGFGGTIPPVLRNGTALSQLAFATPVGAVGGPIEEEGRWLLLEVVDRPEPITGDWAEIREAVEDSLRAAPLADPEYWQWKSEMTERYRVDLAPFFELVDEPSL